MKISDMPATTFHAILLSFGSSDRAAMYGAVCGGARFLLGDQSNHLLFHHGAKAADKIDVGERRRFPRHGSKPGGRWFLALGRCILLWRHFPCPILIDLWPKVSTSPSLQPQGRSAGMWPRLSLGQRSSLAICRREKALGPALSRWLFPTSPHRRWDFCVEAVSPPVGAPKSNPCIHQRKTALF